MHYRMKALLSVLILAACAPATTVSTGPDPSTLDQTLSSDQPWPLRTREHVDLWLHGFAMLQDDTSMIPLFRRGYREQMIVARNAANVTSILDTNRDQLREGFARNRSLFHAQFVAMYFSSGNDLRLAIEYFLRAEGNPQAAGSQEIAQIIAILRGYFPATADRDWLRLFWQSLNDESTRFYHQYWVDEQRIRAPALAAIDSLWQGIYRPRLQNYIRSTQQARGSLIPSLPLNGEGRSLNLPTTGTLIAVTFPDHPANAVEAIYVTVHELAIAVANTAVTDNLTPAEQRSGLGERYQSAAAVRTGAKLLQRLAPELADGYARYYLTAANRPAGTNVQTSLANAFPLTETIRAAIDAQLEIVLGGI